MNELTKELLKEKFEKVSEEVIKGDFLDKLSKKGDEPDPMTKIMFSLSGILIISELKKRLYEELEIMEEK